ncbi:unnamed protein product, partial [Rotaria sordida]
MNKMDIEIERPRVLPDSCAVVLRYVPTDLPREFVIQEILKSIKSAVQFSKINYHRPRATDDFRFCIIDENEYEEVLSIGRLAIGHVLLPITAFIPGLKMTYCNNCWELGHTRYQCKVGPRCRKCLDSWNYNHTCQKAVVCAQCQGPHASLSTECPVVLHYRRTLKEEVNNAVKDGWLNQGKVDNKGGACNVGGGELDYPALNLKPTNKPRLAWVEVQAASSNLQNFQGIDQLGELATQMKLVLDSTRRMELKLDNQVMQMDLLEKKSCINNQAIFVLANIMQQMINASLEKKNKQLLLQKIVQQLEDFKDDLKVKFNALSIDIDHHHQQQQQSKSTLATSPSIPISRITNQTSTSTSTTTTIPINK